MMQSEVTFELVKPRQEELRSLAKQRVRVELGPSPGYRARRGATLAFIRLAERIGLWLHPDPVFSSQETTA